MFLTGSFFIVCDSEAKTKLSRKYLPSGNPGGANFYADEEFAESYKLYKKRRELLKKKKLQGKVNKNTTKESLVNTLKEKKIVNFSNDNNNDEYQQACIVDDGENAMINQHGINLARLKGAVFIDGEEILQYEDRPKNFTSLQEKKVSPVNITIGDDSYRKRICSHDSTRTPSPSSNLKSKNHYNLDATE